MRSLMSLCATVAFCFGVALVGACGSKTVDNDGADVQEDVSVGSDASATDTASGTDATTDSADATIKDVPAPSCASRVGAYTIDGTCTGGASSITFACLVAKECDVSWVSDYRAWSGPLKGNDFTLASPDGTENIVGSFDSTSTGFYHYDNGSLTCDATFTTFDPSQADSLCCDVLANDCKTGDVCVVVAEKPGTTEILTTGCVPLAANPTEEGGACTQSATESQCPAGSLCVRTTGSSGNDGFCQHMCQRVTDCKGGQQCDIVTDAPRSGLCDTACEPFADVTGTTCPAGQACVPTTIAGTDYLRSISTVCATPGTAALGKACGSGTYCAAGLVCSQSVCTPICDDKHPCTTGKCTNFGLPNASSAPAGFGFCK
jgi:hypothetical protein